MPRRPDVPCSICGELMWRATTSLPPGKATCRPCRRANPRTKVKVPKVERVQACIRCGVQIPTGSGYMRLYCTEECRRGRTCEVCGKGYTTQYKLQRTCSRACGWKIRERPEPKLKVTLIKYGCCIVCRGPITSRGKSVVKYCIKHTGYQPTSGPRTVLCVDCGSSFQVVILPSGRPRKRCEACRPRAKRALKSKQGARRRSLVAVAERVDPLYVFSRDGWRCGICHKLVAKDKKVPHPKAPTLDHIVPLALGGDHTAANLQCAHFICNSSKGARRAGQPALIG
jgi:hypothetical protein